VPVAADGETVAVSVTLVPVVTEVEVAVREAVVEVAADVVSVPVVGEIVSVLLEPELPPQPASRTTMAGSNTTAAHRGTRRIPAISIEI
jgi:hypothetical protein